MKFLWRLTFLCFAFLSLTNCILIGTTKIPNGQEAPGVYFNDNQPQIIRDAKISRIGDCAISCEVITNFEVQGNQLSIIERYTNGFTVDNRETDLAINDEKGFGSHATTRLFSTAPVVMKTDSQGAEQKITSQYFFSAGVFVYENNPYYYLGALDYFNYVDDASRRTNFGLVGSRDTATEWSYNDVNWFYVKSSPQYSADFHGNDGEIHYSNGQWDASFDNNNINLSGKVDGIYVYGNLSGTSDNQYYSGQFLGMDGFLLDQAQTAGVFGGMNQSEDTALAGGWYNTEHYMETH